MHCEILFLLRRPTAPAQPPAAHLLYVAPLSGALPPPPAPHAPPPVPSRISSSPCLPPSFLAAGLLLRR
jgi:hypothetical protein